MMFMSCSWSHVVVIDTRNLDSGPWPSDRKDDAGEGWGHDGGGEEHEVALLGGPIDQPFAWEVMIVLPSVAAVVVTGLVLVAAAAAAADIAADGGGGGGGICCVAEAVCGSRGISTVLPSAVVLGTIVVGDVDTGVCCRQRVLSEPIFG